MVTLENETRVIIVGGSGAGKLAYASSSDRVHKFTFPENFCEICTQTSFEFRRLAESLQKLRYTVDESLNALSLRRLRELMFVPRKIQLAPIYNKKPTKTLIRNTLPQRIRPNEKPQS